MYTQDEVAKHKGKSDIWVIYNNRVIDVSNFVSRHPGGEDILAEHAGEDITQYFDDVQHSERAQKLLETYQIGYLKDPNTTKKQSVFQPKTLNTSCFHWTIENFPFPIDINKKMTMGLKTTQEWIICDQYFEMYLHEKEKLISQNPQKMFQVVPGNTLSILGGQEVLKLFSQYLPQRYPTLYELHGHFLKILPLNKMVDLQDERYHPLDIAGQLVQEDLCLLQKNDLDHWVLVAGSLCFPSSWTLSEKLGLEMTGVHAPVPHLNESIGDSIYKFFTKLSPTSPMVERFNWNLENTNKLRLDPNHNENDAITQENVENLTFRVERQTFRKLEKSNMILFTIGILVWPFRDMVMQQDRKRILLSHLKSNNLRLYGLYHRKYRHKSVLIDYLERGLHKL